MELYEEVLLDYLMHQKVQITFPDLKIEPEKIVEIRSYKALQRIKAIIEDDSLEDEECFRKIEEIVQVFEILGSGCENRHDFG